MDARMPRELGHRLMSVTTQEQVTQILAEIDSGHPSAAERCFRWSTRKCAGLPRASSGLRAPATRFSPRRWFTRPTCAWSTRAMLNGQAERISLPSPPTPCDAFSSTTPNAAAASNAAETGQRITLCESDLPSHAADVDLLALDEAMSRLEELDARQCRVVELRFFGGLSVQDTATVLSVSPRTIELDWQMARAWLFQQLK